MCLCQLNKKRFLSFLFRNVRKRADGKRHSDQLIMTGWWYKPLSGLGPYRFHNHGRPGSQNFIYAQPERRSGCSGADGHGTP